MTISGQPYAETDVATFAEAHAAGAYALDVREPHEYVAYRVPGALLMPMGTVTERIAELPTDATVYVVCATGRRSGRVTEYLRTQGIDAVNVAGGTEEWAQQGRTLDQG